MWWFLIPFGAGLVAPFLKDSKVLNDPNKWYGSMECNKCGYEWKARKNTPPARCPKCSSKNIDVVLG